MGQIDDLAALAIEIRDLFIPWFTVNHPELGIISETEWNWGYCMPIYLGCYVLTLLLRRVGKGCVMACDDSPHNRACIYLRYRKTELKPLLTFEIISKDAQNESNAIDKDAFAEEVCH
ncbi:MAG: hypothetical protein ACE5R6_05125 [Candidatus Heimdallarchaeota archaeon]